MRQTVLLTGASGFIGFHTASNLLDRGYQVIAPIRKSAFQSGRVIQLISKGMKFVEGDFHDKQLLDTLFSYNIDSVIHLASIRGQTKTDPREYHRINVVGTQNLIAKSIEYNVRRFVYCSSVGVYGTIPATLPAKTENDYHGDNCYHLSKVEAEKRVLQAKEYGLNTTIIQPTVTYGLYDDGFIPKLSHMVKRHQLIIPNRPVLVHLIWVEKLAELFRRAIEKNLPKEKYIVADKRAVNLLNLVNIFHRSVNKSVYPSWLMAPEKFFRLGEKGLQTMKMNGMLVSLQLISRNWYYQIDDTIRDFNYKPVDTLEKIATLITNGDI